MKTVGARSKEIVFASKGPGKYKYKHEMLFKQLIMKEIDFRQTIDESNEMTLLYSYPAQSLLTVKKTGIREFEIAISRNL
jgi:hypothetical protein